MATDHVVPWEDDGGIVCAFSSVRSGERARLAACLESVGSRGEPRAAAAIDESAYGTRATHMVCGEPRRTLKTLFALARGAWLVGPEWLDACDAEGAWLDPAPYELAAFPGARRARLGIPQSGRLLHGARVHVSAAETNMPAEALHALLRELGAAITDTSSEARIVVESDGDAHAGLHGCMRPAALAGAPPPVRVSEAALVGAVAAFELPPELAACVSAQPGARAPLEPRRVQPSSKPSAPRQPRSPLQPLRSTQRPSRPEPAAPDLAAPSTPADALGQRGTAHGDQASLSAAPTVARGGETQASGAQGRGRAGGGEGASWLAKAARSVEACAPRADAQLHDAPAEAPALAPARTVPRRQSARRESSAGARSAGGGAAALACGVFPVGSGLQLHVICGRGEHSAEYFVIEDVLFLFRARLRGCNVDLHATDGAAPAEAPARAANGTPARARSAGGKRRRCVDFLGDLLAGPLISPGGAAGRFTLALVPEAGGAPIAALTLHVHARCAVAEILLCAVRQQRARRGLGRAMVECALHALGAGGAARSVVCIASHDSVGFWDRLRFSRDTNLSAAAWDALCDPFDDSVVLELRPDVVASGDTRAAPAAPAPVS